MRKFLILMILAGTVTITRAAGEMKQPMIGMPAPPFQLQSPDGKTLALSDLRGKVVVLHFGAGW